MKHHSTVISLSVHKNTLEKRKSKNFKKAYRKAAKSCESNNMDGFAIVSWDKDGARTSCYDCGDMNPSHVPDFVKDKLISHIYGK